MAADPRRLHGPPVRRLRTRQELSPADRAHPVWLFDLDNTLHNTSHAIFSHINVGMTAAVARTLGVDQDEANRLRAKYWHRYGATVIGMHRHHGVDVREFLALSHDFEVGPLVRAPKGLARMLARLPGRKVLVTNAPLDYARAVLKHLKALRAFDSIWAIEQMRIHGTFRPKPSVALMRYVLAREGIPASRAVLVEDTLCNLRGARAAGIRTVHVFHPGTPFAKLHRGRADYVDLRVNSVEHLLQQRRPVRRR
ncbi:pyrimidine 5'-nucleotidase [Orrella sp. JC864]|uniref:pyrimidine 5'-nucleotidase n=1 Tax=Orrella sp. JC864 TaxID=3120298 RepID=UPI003008B063